MSTIEIARAEIAEWLATAVGIKHDPDRSFGCQCVDLADSYVETLFQRPWRDTIGAVGGARELMDTADPAYFTKVWNDPAKPDQLPPTGAIIIWDGTGNRVPNPNPYGHVAVNIIATAAGCKVVQQDGFAAPLKWIVTDARTGAGAWFSDKPAHLADLGWDNPGTGMVRGWLIPKVDKIKDTDAIKRVASEVPVIPALKPTATVAPGSIMHGIDVASWQKGIDLAKVSADFVIVKVSGGTGYLNPEAKFQVRAARAAGRLVGLYHYAHEAGYGPAAPEHEAKFFLDNALPLMDENTVLVLDWEADTVVGKNASGLSGNVWAKRFLDKVAAETGTTPWLYGYKNAIEAHQWPSVAKTYPLWYAWYGSDAEMSGYADDFTLPFTVPAGFKLAAWQYTQRGKLPGYSGHLDFNVFFGTGDTWRGFARGKSPKVSAPKKVTVTTASNTNLAPKPKVHVVRPGETLQGIADLYGTTIPAIRARNAFIKDPNYLAVADRITIPAAPAVTQCIVEAGDTVSSIAAQFGTTVARVASRNPGIDLNLIHPGQVLNL